MRFLFRCGSFKIFLVFFLRTHSHCATKYNGDMPNQQPTIRRLSTLAFALSLVGVAIQPTVAQIAKESNKPATADSTRLGKPLTIHFRVGAEITATRGACRNLVAMVTVPLECPEQKVSIVNEDFSPAVREVNYRSLRGGEVKQMLISIPYLAAGATAHAIVTSEVTTWTILPPEKTDDLKIPKPIPSKLKIYTNGSPYIEVNHPRIHALSKELLADVSSTATDWQKVEAIYDGVLKKIAYVEGPDKSAGGSPARRKGRLPRPLRVIHCAVSRQ